MQQSLLFSLKNTTGFFLSSKSVVLYLALLGATITFGQQPFITTWKTDNPGDSDNTSITIPTGGGAYNYEVDWNNDGIYDESGIMGDVTHDFGTAGTYTIGIRGTFPGIVFAGGGDCLKLLNISQWGAIAWAEMANAYSGCANLNITATDLPDLSSVTDMSFMFGQCSTLNGPVNIGSWNMGSVTNMSFMFLGASSFNRSINGWTTGAVTQMQGMFLGASAFNQPLNSWNTAAVTDMNGMFATATAFNQPLNSWNTAAVLDMNFMFASATAFDQPLNGWNTGAVANMSSMFSGASAFNQPLNGWNTTAVTDMSFMFVSAASFDQPLNSWNAAAVDNMSSMFGGATSFNQSLASWNTAAVNNMSFMFLNAGSFNQPLGSWTLAPGVDLSNMLDDSGLDCTNYSTTLIGWSTNPVTPNDLNLGANSRQYGTEAVAARTNLEVAKNWTINGDTPSGMDCGAALPVTWISFTGKRADTQVQLHWATAAEQSNKGFHISRSSDGLHWYDIGFVAGRETSADVQNYTFTDDRALSGPSYYRLRQEDFDGTQTWSKVVSVAGTGDGKHLQIFPNPVSGGELVVSVPEIAGEASTLRLFDVSGQLLRAISLNSETYLLDISDLVTGLYMVEISGANGRSFEKVAVQH